jgi:hypothetical protein
MTQVLPRDAFSHERLKFYFYLQNDKSFTEKTSECKSCFLFIRLIPKLYIFCCWRSFLKCYRLKIINILRNLKFSYILTLFDLQWLKLTFKQQNMYSKYHNILGTSNFDLHMRIFNLPGLGAPDRL